MARGRHIAVTVSTIALAALACGGIASARSHHRDGNHHHSNSSDMLGSGDSSGMSSMFSSMMDSMSMSPTN